MFNSLFDNGSYNIHIANLFGLESAIYLSAVLSVCNSDDFVQLDRELIKNRTTLTLDSQKNYDSMFTKMSVFEFRSKDEVKVNYSALLSLFNEDNKTVIFDMIPKVAKKRTKSDIMKDELKSYIRTDNGELRDAYSAWIDAVFAKQGWMSKKSVELGQKLIDEYSNRNLDVAIELLNIASIGGYRDIQWAINSYEENIKKKAVKAPFILNKEFEPKKIIELAQEVF